MIADFTGTQREVIRHAIVNSPSVLDVGCGDGSKTHFISQNANHSVGVDPDEKFIQVAKSRYRGDNIEFHVGSAESLNFTNSYFSAVLFNESLHHIPTDKQKMALREAFRVLLPHGTLLIIEPIHGSGTFAQIMRLFSDEKDQKKKAKSAIEAVIDTEFTLSNKDNINIEYHCHGLDDLFEYSAMPEQKPQRNESFKKEALKMLEQCSKSSNGDFILDYSATVWCLIKK